MKTIFMLMGRYDGRVVIPLEEVRTDYFPHLAMGALLRKLSSGEIALPILRIEDSQKSAKGVHLQDLADYIDKRRFAGLKEMQSLRS